MLEIVIEEVKMKLKITKLHHRKKKTMKKFRCSRRKKRGAKGKLEEERDC
jgi:hypothetical protein